MKYCPKCLKEVTPSPLKHLSEQGGMGCVDCGVIAYCNDILLDSPDKEAQKLYLLKEFLTPRINYAYDVEEVIKDLTTLLKK